MKRFEIVRNRTPGLINRPFLVGFPVDTPLVLLCQQSFLSDNPVITNEEPDNIIPCTT